MDRVRKPSNSEYLYSWANTTVRGFSAALRRRTSNTFSISERIFIFNYLICQTASPVNLFTEFICLGPELVTKLRFKIWGRMVPRHVGNKSLKFTVLEAKRLRRKAPLLSFTNLDERQPPPDCNWQPWTILEHTKKPCGPQRARFSLWDLNCQLKPPAIKIRSSISPGKASLRVTTSANVKHIISKWIPIECPYSPTCEALCLPTKCKTSSTLRPSQSN
jgi:hypothetical protein